ncbi:uncharacterized protein LOC119067014 isoform X2 [Bradysia coprophila]|uniref:uncharacterized protein LOC119067014 isoform X2 n=1 Tax=Bradysia coprophila TaxID=38358 RepID=UPI00187DC4A3|nr:uncharacterized protein LOC119067014 isoform X2 [Bradysia coprophila]
MATAIKNFYLEEFVPSYQSASGRLIDISKLVEENKNWTPIPLPYSNKTQSVMNLSAAIIVNICRTYHNTTLLPKKAFELITELITASTDNPDVVAKQIFLTHITKRIMNVEVFSFHVVRNNCMKIKNVLFDDERKWVELAEKVMSHRQINGKIDECLADFGQPVHELTDIEYEQTKVKVTLVESAAAMVRGFAGFHEIFINADHFRQKIDNFKGDTHLLQLVAKIDIISVVLHEYGHIKIRQP